MRSSHATTVARISAALVLAAMSAACSATDDGNDALTEDGTTRAALGSTLERQLERARTATAKYHDVAVARGDGFDPASACVSVPGLGTMGVHFVSHSRLTDGALTIEEPEALLYLPRKEGGWRLVAIEYLAPIVIDGAPYMGCGVENNSCPPPNPPPSPDLFENVTFDGPMAGHEEGMPWHYDLHVWIWTHNPSGLFAPFNPALACE
jgi:hypothetical protein